MRRVSPVGPVTRVSAEGAWSKSGGGPVHVCQGAGPVHVCQGRACVAGGTGEAEAELRRFAPFYRKQFCVARFNEVQSEQQQEQTLQLLRQKAPPEGGEVVYEDAVFYFDETRKWRERYIVVRANYSLECHESLESFLKGGAPLHRLLPTGGAVLTTEEKYMQLVDQCFPDDSSVKEDFAPPLSSMPGQFPVYLRLPYRRDSYFCFKQQQRQEAFLSVLLDCVRHQNQDFLKKSSCEVKSFLKAVQFYRESQGRFRTWDMTIGSDVRVLSNLVMEKLLPLLEKDLLPKLKAKKTEKKRLWFAVQPYLASVLEELMDPISRGFSQGRELCAGMMEQVGEEVLQGVELETVKKALWTMSRPRLGDSYSSISSLEDKLQLLKERFGFKNVKGIVQSSQIDLQRLMENAAHTYEILLFKILEENPENAAAAIDKTRLRVLKQFDYDSSSTRKRIFEEALVQITLPFLKEQLQEPRKQLEHSAENVLLDHCDFIEIENVYEDVLLSVLHKDPALFSSSPAPSRTSPALTPASSPLIANHNHSPVTQTNQEVRSDADQAGDINGNKTENTNLGKASDEQEEARVIVEEICDVLEETGSEVKVETEEKEAGSEVKVETEEKEAGSEVKVETEEKETGSAEKESENQEKALEDVNSTENHAKEKVREVAEVKISEVQDDVFEEKEENVSEVKEEVVLSTESESLDLKSEGNGPNEAATNQVEEEKERKQEEEEEEKEEVVKEEEKKEEEENKMVDDTQTAETVKTVCEAGNAEKQQEVKEEVKEEKEEEIKEEVKKEEDKVKEEEEEKEEKKVEEDVEEEEEEGSDDEGSTTSDVLEENSQSLQSSEDDSQSERRRQEVSKEAEEPEQEQPAPWTRTRNSAPGPGAGNSGRPWTVSEPSEIW
ncbi:hypothetical protein WMY93_033611 [Mugilogobius chulae]|uniref:Niban 1/2/3 domain-containing protein n=1 Tax=Mugilogobius chulae TaxID=88201 RepID=A0AAW0MN20_9GOBI